MSISPRSNVEAIKPAIHGSPDYEELEKLGIPPGSIVDFSVGFNPLGALPGLADKLAGVPVDKYPDSRATELRNALAGKLKVRSENIIAGNGSSELMWLCALAYFGPGDRVLLLEPVFGEYETACRVAGSQPVKLKLSPPNFKPMADTIINAARQHRVRAMFLCNPNNPTGNYLSRDEVEAILDGLPECLLILDEAYVSFTDSPWPSEDLIQGGNVIILRSMTKDYGLAGLRLGYALAGPGIISNLRRVCPPWNVNSLAQRAGLLVLEDDGHLRRGREAVREATSFLFRELAKLGLSPLPSQANFFLVKVGQAAALRQALLQRGILVRDCSSFGLPEYIRLAARPLPDCEKLISALKDMIDLS